MMLGARTRARSLGGRARVARSAVAMATLLAAVGAGLVVAPPVAGADGVPFAPKICTGGGSVRVVRGGAAKWLWSLKASGSCQEREPVDQTNPSVGVPILPLEEISLVGSGTSTTLGICDTNKKTAIVTNLNLKVAVSFTDVVTGNTVTQNEIWSAPVTTYPVITLFVTSSGAQPTGVGVVASHMFAGCTNAGNSPSALFTFVEVVPGAIT